VGVWVPISSNARQTGSIFERYRDKNKGEEMISSSGSTLALANWGVYHDQNLGLEVTLRRISKEGTEQMFRSLSSLIKRAQKRNSCILGGGGGGGGKRKCEKEFHKNGMGGASSRTTKPPDFDQDL